MNKTLLLIICDFLLLNLLALTRWEQPPEEMPSEAELKPADTAEQVVQEDLVAALRVTLDEERLARESLDAELQTTQSELQERQESLAEREQRLAALDAELARKQQEAAQLSERVADSQATLVQLSDRLQRTAEQAASSRAQAEQLAKELAERQAAAERLQQQLSTSEQEKQRVQQEYQSLSTQYQVAESERTMLRDNVQTLTTQVQAEREERVRLAEQTGTLAEGVTQLAERTADVRDEIRSNTPINANTLFNDFLANRVHASFRAVRDGFFGPSTSTDAPRTVFVSDGTTVFALFHASDTPAALREFGPNWRELSGTLTAGTRTIAPDRLQYLHLDPRVVVTPVDPAAATASGLRVYPVAREPFKFPEAVLVKRGGENYGEVEFRLDPSTPGYVRMSSSVLGRISGRFSPSTGDIVFSKTGEVLGLMVNNTYCAVLGNFGAAAELPFGRDLTATPTGDTISRQYARIMRLPLRLQ